VFSSRPVYYETRDGSWRSLHEIAFYGTNGKLVLLPRALSRCSVRFMRWLAQYERALGHNLMIGHPRAAYAGVQLRDLAVAHTRDFFPDPTGSVTTAQSCANAASTWAAAHDAATGIGQGSPAASVRETTGSTEYTINRGFALFDTSILSPVNPQSATHSLFIFGLEDDDNDGDDWVNIVQSSPASNDEIVDADFDQCGAVTNPTEGATRIDLGSMTNAAYNTWTLNATGLGWINKTGITKLGQREGHDALNAPIESNCWNQFVAQGHAGLNPPKLTVTFLSPSAFSVVMS
jgi:hypothetical protein